MESNDKIVKKDKFEKNKEFFNKNLYIEMIIEGVNHSNFGNYGLQNKDGEYESTQLIMTAKKNIKKYTVETFDLTSGEHVFEKSRIEVYHQKYITVENIFDQNGMPAGNYPDALLPIETAVKYKENNIQDGNNQGLFITFNVPVSQPAGVYTGNIKISFDGAMTDSMSLSNMPKNLPVIYERFPATVGSKPSMAVPIWEAGAVSATTLPFWLMTQACAFK